MPSTSLKSYIICTSPRSGSTLLCKLLAATGVAGNPDSYFHRPSVSAWLKSLNLKLDSCAPGAEVLEAIITAAMAQGTLGTGIFGLRLQRHSFDFFIQQLAVHYPGLPNDVARLDQAFGRTAFIHLTRGDKIEQAVSYVRAEQSGLWHVAADGTELERVSAPQTLKYDQRRISDCVQLMKAYEHQWEMWFSEQGIKPLRVTYEALSAQPTESLIEVLDHLGLKRQAANGVKPAVAKMGNALNRQWVSRFRAAPSFQR